MKRILIVEDDPVAAKIYSTRLTREGFEVKIATDGQSGLDALNDFKPEGFLIDFMLPKINGLELTKKIRANPNFEKAIIVVYSNAVVPQVKQLAQEAGATHLFDKSDLSPALLVRTFQTPAE